jgi:hypothetical protein
MTASQNAGYNLGYTGGHVEIAEPGHCRTLTLGYHTEIQDVCISGQLGVLG